MSTKMQNNYVDSASQLLQNPQGTTYLAFRDLPEIIKTYVCGKKTLDYGCGVGRSTRILASYDLDVDGVDITTELMDVAKTMSYEISYNIIDTVFIANHFKYYDLVFSSFVLGDIASTSELQVIFNNKYSLLKSGGVVIIITCNSLLYQKEWLTIDSNFTENTHLEDGALTKIFCRHRKIFFYDYFWTQETYKKMIEAKFSILLHYSPLGTLQDPYIWCDEYYYSPYSIWVARKIS